MPGRKLMEMAALSLKQFFSRKSRRMVYNWTVPNFSADVSVKDTADYCRRARKIRASFDHNPLLRHRALTDLARERNLQLLVTPQRKLIPSRSPQVAFDEINPQANENDFAVQAAACRQPFGFTFSDRIKLLNIAEQMGISRFRANMILAMHEHQTGRAAPKGEGKPFTPSLLAVLLVEGAVVAGLVWLCCAL